MSEHGSETNAGKVEQTEPPALVGEVWRGVSGWRTVAITRMSMRGGEWYPDPLGHVGAQVWRPEDGAWGNPAGMQQQADAFLAWGRAMSAEVAAQRERAERAEAIAKAERALRVAWETIANAPPSQMPAAYAALTAAQTARAALGVDP